MFRTQRFLPLTLALSAVLGAALPAAATAPASSAWVERSNQNAQLLLEVLARFNPETAGQIGVSGLDTEIIDLKPRLVERFVAETGAALSQLRQRLSSETDPRVRQDLEILIAAGERFAKGLTLQNQHQLQYINAPETIFLGLRALLDERVPAERRGAALVRLKRYAGLEDGFSPITQLAEERMRERLTEAELQGPVRDEVEKGLGNSATYIAGIGKLFEKFEIPGYQEAYAQLQTQLAAHGQFVRDQILPRAREDFRLHPELYAFALEQSGIDMSADELVSRAEVAFREIQNEMQTLALLVAAEKGFEVSDYRAVIRELKKQQLVGEAILPHYQRRIGELETLIDRTQMVTLPERAMEFRFASEAESASIPAPHMDPPRLIGNTGEMGAFVLPLQIPGSGGADKLSFDDFTFDAASWTLTVHEGRPGHELQFAAMIEGGVSIARVIFALNSVNVEGWALYAEAEMKPYLPLDGQLISLQHRLMRAARAILDPGLQRGSIDRATAMRVLQEDVVLSEAMATQEVERYTFWAPGQAPSYFCGYTRLMELRTEAERALGPDFDRRAFHDFILSQGALPPALLRQAVVTEFIPSRARSAQQAPAGPAVAGAKESTASPKEM
ncbi:MAG TPA: DUF885 domain-containing protein [Acidobacteriota bacterium]